MEEGFYKADNGELLSEEGFYKADSGELLFAPNAVYNANFTLQRELAETYEYPVDGWAWYESRDAAEFGLMPVTAERVVAEYFSAYQLIALQRLEFALVAAGKPLGPAMTAAKQWLEAAMFAWSADPTPKPQAIFGSPAASFEEASAEALTILSQ
jgi:hypothetical protein